MSVLADEFSVRRLKVINKTSASQIDLFETCQRKWANSYIFCDRPEPSPAQIRGTAIHLELEHYLTTGEIRDSEYVELVKEAAKFLPANLTNMARLIESEISLDTYEGGPQLVGFIDYADNEDGFRILDFKTTSNFRYCKTPEQLQTNTQLIVYSKWAYGAEDRVNVSLVYLRTRDKPAVRQVGPVSLPRAHVEAQWALRLDTIREMVQAAATIKTAEELEPNTEHCNDFGGCPFRAKCGLITISTGGFSAMGKGSSEGLLEKLAAAKKARQDAAAGTPETPSSPWKIDEARVAAVAHRPDAISPPDAPSRTSTPAEIETVASAPKKRGRPKKHVQEFEASPALVSVPQTGIDLAETANAMKASEEALLRAFTAATEDLPETKAAPIAALMEPAAPIPASDAQATIKCPLCGERPEVSAFAAHYDAHETTSSTLPDVPVEIVSAPPAEVVSRTEVPYALIVTEPPSAFVIPFPTEDPTLKIGTTPARDWKETAPKSVAMQLKEALEEKKIPGTRKKPPVAPLLFIDCTPTKSPDGPVPMLLEDWLGPIAELVALAREVEDWRLIKYTAKGDLAIAIRDALDQCPAVLLIDSRSSGAEVALEVLTPYAAMVVRGNR